MKRKILLVVALGLGAVITWIDSQPNWDDTGVTAGALLLSCVILGALEPERPLLVALAVGSWIPIVGIVRGNYGAILAVLFAFAGAFLGMAIRRAIGKALTADPT